MNNLNLLDLCIKNPEKFSDKHYMFIEKDKDLPRYVIDTKKIKSKLIATKEIMDRRRGESLLKDLLSEIQDLLKNYKTNNSEFGCFINACDLNCDEAARDRDLLLDITKLYFKKRDITEVVPSEWLQAIIDKTSSKKKGSVGVNNLISILEDKKYIKANSLDNLTSSDFSYAKLSKRGKFSNKIIQGKFSIDFGSRTQGKTLDLLIKKKKDIYFLEAKHLNTGGGGQNKQILELIDLIRINPPSRFIHIVGFLDGVYFNKIFSPTRNKRLTDDKLREQKKDTIASLTKNKSNYFINTFGFSRLF